MKKKYSINWENDKLTSVEVDGVEYDGPDHIPDAQDRAQVRRLMAKSKGKRIDRAGDKELDNAFDEEFDEKFRQLERQTAHFPTMIVAIFLGIAVIMLSIAGISIASTTRALSREVSAPGNVLDYAASQDEDGQVFYYPLVEFYLPDGSRQRAQLPIGSSSQDYIRGEAVTILYDPTKPDSSARIQSFGGAVSMWLLPLITGTMGLIFLGAALFAWWFLKSESEEK